MRARNGRALTPLWMGEIVYALLSLSALIVAFASMLVVADMLREREIFRKGI